MEQLRPIHKQVLRKLDTGEYAYHYQWFWMFDSSKTMYSDYIIDELIKAGYVTRDDWDDEKRIISTGKEWS